MIITPLTIASRSRFSRRQACCHGLRASTPLSSLCLVPSTGERLDNGGGSDVYRHRARRIPVGPALGNSRGTSVTDAAAGTGGFVPLGPK